MSGNFRRENYQALQPEQMLDEGYWESLLQDGEYVHSTDPSSNASHTLIPDYPFQLSINPVQVEKTRGADWDEAQQIMITDQILELDVIGSNRGGLLVDWKSLRGFIPTSQLVGIPEIEDEQERNQLLRSQIGQSLRLRVIELNPDKNRFILSERAAQVAAGAREELLTILEPGQTISGQVTNLCDFGAFVDLGGVEGLVHISELSWGRVRHPSDMLRRDQNINVYILDVKPGEARVALSIKRLYPDPWELVDQKYHIGQIVQGRITNVVDFGAFACIEDGLEGLIHYSELAEGHFLHPRNVVSEGEIIQARILTINGKSRRLGLSLRLE